MHLWQNIFGSNMPSVNPYFCGTPTREVDYVRQIKAGSMRLRPQARAVFLSRVVKQDNGCWSWQGANNVHLGNSQSIQPHVLAFVIFRGAPGAQAGNVCRTCHDDACVNPEHLRIGARSPFGVYGRPRIGVARLNVTIDGVVQDELARCEHEQGAHRNDVARHVLCEWAQAQRASRLSG